MRGSGKLAPELPYTTLVIPEVAGRLFPRAAMWGLRTETQISNRDFPGSHAPIARVDLAPNEIE